MSRRKDETPEEYRARRRAYRAANREHVLSREKAWRAAHPGRFAAYYKAWFEENRQRVMEYRRAWAAARAEDGKDYRAYHRAYAKANQFRAAGMTFNRKSDPPELIAVAEKIRETKQLIRQMEDQERGQE